MFTRVGNGTASSDYSERVVFFVAGNSIGTMTQFAQLTNLSVAVESNPQDVVLQGFDTASKLGCLNATRAATFPSTSCTSSPAHADLVRDPCVCELFAVCQAPLAVRSRLRHLGSLIVFSCARARALDATQLVMDMDENGLNDFVFFCPSMQGVSLRILLRTSVFDFGAPVTTLQTNFMTTPVYSALGGCLVAGRFNNDSYADLLFLPGSSVATGYFALRQALSPTNYDLVALPSGFRGSSATVADVDSNGWVDVVVSTRQPGSVILYRMTGQANLTSMPPVVFDMPEGVASFALADFNGDAQLDIIVATETALPALLVFLSCPAACSSCIAAAPSPAAPFFTNSLSNITTCLSCVSGGFDPATRCEVWSARKVLGRRVLACCLVAHVTLFMFELFASSGNAESVLRQACCACVWQSLDERVRSACWCLVRQFFLRERLQFGWPGVSHVRCVTRMVADPGRSLFGDGSGKYACAVSARA